MGCGNSEKCGKCREEYSALELKLRAMERTKNALVAVDDKMTKALRQLQQSVKSSNPQLAQVIGHLINRDYEAFRRGIR